MLLVLRLSAMEIFQRTLLSTPPENPKADAKVINLSTQTKQMATKIWLFIQKNKVFDVNQAKTALQPYNYIYS